MLSDTHVVAWSHASRTHSALGCRPPTLQTMCPNRGGSAFPLEGFQADPRFPEIIINLGWQAAPILEAGQRRGSQCK